MKYIQFSKGIRKRAWVGGNGEGGKGKVDDVSVKLTGDLL